MKICELIQEIDVLQIVGDTQKAVTDIQFDSRRVQKGSLFVAQVGVHVDGHNYITSAIEKGAVAVVCEQMPETIAPNVVYIKTSDSNKALGYIASILYN